MGLVMVCKEQVHFDEPRGEVGLSKACMEPQVTSFVIDQDTEVTPLSQGRCIHWATDIRVEAAKTATSCHMAFLERALGHLPADAGNAVKVLQVIWDAGKSV